MGGKQTEKSITNGVKNGFGGNASVKYRVVGAKPNNKPTILSSGSEEHLLFEYDSS